MCINILDCAVYHRTVLSECNIKQHLWKHYDGQKYVHLIDPITVQAQKVQHLVFTINKCQFERLPLLCSLVMLKCAECDLKS